MKLMPTIATLAAPLLLLGCGQKYETGAECELQELMKLGEQVEGGREVVAAYCADYFDQQQFDQGPETRSTGVRLMRPSDWVRLVGAGDFISWVDQNSIFGREDSKRSALIRTSGSEEQLNLGVYEISEWEFDCATLSSRIVYSIEYGDEDGVWVKDFPDPLSRVIPESNGANRYNFVCSYEIED